MLSFAQAGVVEAYDKARKHIFESTAELLNTWQQSFFTCAEGNDASRHQYLEIGCGPGSVTRNHLLPLCPPTLKRLVGTDISEAMLDYARTAHCHPKVDYRLLDITADQGVSRFIAEEGRFQRVYSFLALHCIQDKAAALRNIERLMTPGGECLVMYNPYARLAQFHRALLESESWGKYHDVSYALCIWVANRAKPA
ncbi:juvenile hormone acid O-methyltransferase-like [Rhipicephalus sanguineus]|uniref:juvenile hormone acid O-methyltransferase-like n=1 Tax=Rhipicephalus sanguineus TaxID=34632 RepID=UPI00189469DA|nr:juvenile hormone acid O-methyltransferase-like [Rhipicephalus sanguineus]